MSMDVFDLDRAIVKDYERFARSFTKVRAEDIRSQVDALYATGRSWPEPLISINPHYERGANISELVTEGFLHPDTARVFQIDGEPITLYRHQRRRSPKRQQAIVSSSPKARVQASLCASSSRSSMPQFEDAQTDSRIERERSSFIR
jgi:hypothetical protein